MMSDFTLKFAGYFLSIVFLYLTFRDTNISVIIEHLEYINYYYIFIGLVLITIFYFIRSLYQKNNLKYINPELSFSVSLQSIVLSYFFNTFLPARLGEVIRAFFLAKKNNITRRPPCPIKAGINDPKKLSISSLILSIISTKIKATKNIM